MKAKFWIEERKLKDIFEELIEKEGSHVSLWEIFTDYSTIYQNQKPANESKGWLDQQDTIIDEIIVKHLSDSPFNRHQIELLLDAIQEFTFPETEQGLENIYSKYRDLASLIAKTYVIPLKMNDKTLDGFFDSLESKLEKRNQNHIVESDKEAARQEIRLKGIKGVYSKEKVDQTLQALEAMWANMPENQEEEEDDFEEEEIERDEFIYQKISLAHSNTFYGFNNDAGDLPYEEQEKLANEKFEQYKNEISELLGQNPDESLHPKLDFSLIEANELWDVHYDCIEHYPFMNEFEGDFAAWKQNEKVLFLSVNKEDKELPYLVNLGGINFKKYSEVLEKYNKITTIT